LKTVIDFGSEVVGILSQAAKEGATIWKKPQKVFRGGERGGFKDLEVIWL